MPYDPNFPATGAELVSAGFRNQFNGIKDLIDAVPAGPPGPQGEQGPPGQVSIETLNGAIATTSSNSNAVPALDTPFTNDPPTLADIEVLRAKINELVAALRR